MTVVRKPIHHVLLEMAEKMAHERSVCPGGYTGCALVTQDGRVLAMGYNGPPHGWSDALTECKRDALDLHGGVGYEVCPCVHAEANALAHAARHGVATEGAIALCTRKPCCACAKSLLQAGIRSVAFYDAGKNIVEQSIVDVLSSRIAEAVEILGEDES
jgi:dCMP deaminase